MVSRVSCTRFGSRWDVVACVTTTLEPSRSLRQSNGNSSTVIHGIIQIFFEYTYSFGSKRGIIVAERIRVSECEHPIRHTPNSCTDRLPEPTKPRLRFSGGTPQRELPQRRRDPDMLARRHNRLPNMTNQPMRHRTTLPINPRSTSVVFTDQVQPRTGSDRNPRGETADISLQPLCRQLGQCRTSGRRVTTFRTQRRSRLSRSERHTRR
jgi:hypothetical protein